MTTIIIAGNVIAGDEKRTRVHLLLAFLAIVLFLTLACADPLTPGEQAWDQNQYNARQLKRAVEFAEKHNCAAGVMCDDRGCWCAELGQ